MDDDLIHQWVTQHRRLQNYMAAIRELQLTPQERYAYQHHLHNLGLGGVKQPNGEISTYLSRSFTMDDGRTYMLPTVWDNKIVPNEEAVQRSIAAGLDKWPSYDTVDQAEERYNAMHGYMERDHANTPDVPVRGMFLPDGGGNGPGAMGRPRP